MAARLKKKPLAKQETARKARNRLRCLKNKIKNKPKAEQETAQPYMAARFKKQSKINVLTPEYFVPQAAFNWS